MEKLEKRIKKLEDREKVLTERITRLNAKVNNLAAKIRKQKGAEPEVITNIKKIKYLRK